MERLRNSASRKRARRFRSALPSFFFIGPALMLYGGFIVLPAVIGFAYSLSDWNGWESKSHFIGLANFVELLHDERFFNCTKLTLWETAMMVVCFSFGAMVLAVLLDRLRFFKGLIRALFFYPYVLSVVVSGLIFQYLA